MNKDNAEKLPPLPTATGHDTIGKLVLKRPRNKAGARAMINGLIDGHIYPPIRVVIEWDDRWQGR